MPCHDLCCGKVSQQAYVMRIVVYMRSNSVHALREEMLQLMTLATSDNSCYHIRRARMFQRWSSRYRQTCLEFGIRLGLICDRSFSMQGVQDRFRTLENVRLPDMDNRIERAGTALVSKVCTSS